MLWQQLSQSPLCQRRTGDKSGLQRNDGTGNGGFNSARVKFSRREIYRCGGLKRGNMRNNSEQRNFARGQP